MSKRLEAKSIEEIDQLLTNDEGFKELIKYCAQVFKFLDNVYYDLKSRNIMDAPSTDEALSKVVGYRGFLVPILETLEAHKKGEENSYYISYKEECEKKGEKFTSAIGDRVASKYVQAVRTLRNKVRGYVDQCYLCAMILQSKLKHYDKEITEEK